MKFFTLAAAALALSLSMVVSDAEAAKRLGGGRDTGMQRQTTTEKAPANTTPGQAPNSANATAALICQLIISTLIYVVSNEKRLYFDKVTSRCQADVILMMRARTVPRPSSLLTVNSESSSSSN